MKSLMSLALLFLTACSNASAMCSRGEAVVDIMDAAAWADYVAAARVADLDYQRSNSWDQSKFVSPLIIVPGFELDAPHIHWFADSGIKITSKPRRSDVTILRDGKPIAILQNYVWSDWLGNSHYQCVTDYRELYGIRRRPVK